MLPLNKMTPECLENIVADMAYRLTLHDTPIETIGG